MEKRRNGQRMVAVASVMCTVLMMPAAKGQSGAGVTQLTVSANHRYLVDQNHVTYLLQGDAGWSLIVVPSDQEVEQYLKNRRDKGFNAVLAELDFVIASPHISLKQDERKATDRLKRAIEHPYVNIIGHPTGRLINSREGLPLRFDELFPVAAANGTAMEINAGYPRLDLNEINARAAIQAGVMLSINTDAHSPDGFDEMIFGVNVARRAWVTKSNVINCLSLNELTQFLSRD